MDEVKMDAIEAVKAMMKRNDISIEDLDGCYVPLKEYDEMKSVASRIYEELSKKDEEEAWKFVSEKIPYRALGKLGITKPQRYKLIEVSTTFTVAVPESYDEYDIENLIVSEISFDDVELDQDEVEEDLTRDELNLKSFINNVEAF